MKRKGNRDIPDFSKKRAPAPGVPAATDAKAKAAPPAPVRGKPQSKSAKSGQRGR
ncbi:MAG: hypothetical protein JWM41_4288 [Gemmatimonadetes bacterium]|nr:hypothetical protein [Gemmatimonadota bacterium]